MKKYIMTLCLSILFAASGMAQKQTVKGKVVDEQGEPIIGATVAPAGDKSKGVITDLDGKYTISVPKGTKVTIT